MIEWRKPEFTEIRMDAEISCYSFVLDDMRAFTPLRRAADQDAPPELTPRPLP